MLGSGRCDATAGNKRAGCPELAETLEFPRFPCFREDPEHTGKGPGADRGCPTIGRHRCFVMVYKGCRRYVGKSDMSEICSPKVRKSERPNVRESESPNVRESDVTTDQRCTRSKTVAADRLCLAARLRHGELDGLRKEVREAAISDRPDATLP